MHYRHAATLDIVDHNVEPAPFLCDPAAQGRHRSLLPQIRGHQEVAAVTAEFRLQSRHRFRPIQPGQSQPRALLRQSTGNRPANAPGRAQNQGPFAIQLHLATSLPVFYSGLRFCRAETATHTKLPGNAVCNNA